MNIFYTIMGAKIRYIIILLLFYSIIFTNCLPSTAAIPKTTVILTSDIANLGTVTTLEKTFNSTITIKYNYGPLARPDGKILKFLKNNRNPTIITLSVSSKPDWCTAQIAQTNISIPITRTIFKGNDSKETIVKITVNTTNVKAQTTGNIIINANATQNGNLRPTSTSLTYTVIVGFIPKITYEIIDEITKPLAPGKYGNFSIKINNTSNEKIKITLNQTTSSKYFIVTVPSSTEIEQNTQKAITIPIRATEINTSINETTKLTFNLLYTMSTDETLLGPTQQFEVSRSIRYQPEKENAIDFSPAFIGIAIIFLIIIGFFSFLTIRQKQYD